MSRTGEACFPLILNAESLAGSCNAARSIGDGLALSGVPASRIRGEGTSLIKPLCTTAFAGDAPFVRAAINA